jgi:hypothetical protein
MARGGMDYLKTAQAGINSRGQQIGMAQGRNAADGETSRRPHKISSGPFALAQHLQFAWQCLDVALPVACD